VGVAQILKLLYRSFLTCGCLRTVDALRNPAASPTTRLSRLHIGDTAQRGEAATKIGKDELCESLIDSLILGPRGTRPSENSRGLREVREILDIHLR
jgi:hypothetical protein